MNKLRVGVYVSLKIEFDQALVCCRIVISTILTVNFLPYSRCAEYSRVHRQGESRDFTCHVVRVQGPKDGRNLRGVLETLPSTLS